MGLTQGLLLALVHIDDDRCALVTKVYSVT